MMKHNTNRRTSQNLEQGGRTRPMHTSNSDTLYSEDLFRHGRTVDIMHNGECYTLRLTATNKLLLTK